jgi:uncharacterized protein (DUF983 family)
MNHPSLPMQPRNLLQSMLNGARGRCPRCGEGSLFRKFLKVADACPACGEHLHHHRADDMPAYIVITIVGHVVVPIAFAVETAYRPDYVWHFLLWVPLTLGLSLALLQPVKGAIVGLQWALRMHGFDSRADDEEHGALLMQPAARRTDE